MWSKIDTKFWIVQWLSVELEKDGESFFFSFFIDDWLIDWFLVFNATFNNISAISWRPVLVVEEAGVPGENHRPWASNWLTLLLAAVSRRHLFLSSPCQRQCELLPSLGVRRPLAFHILSFSSETPQPNELATVGNSCFWLADFF